MMPSNHEIPVNNPNTFFGLNFSCKFNRILGSVSIMGECNAICKINKTPLSGRKKKIQWKIRPPRLFLFL